MELSNDLQIFAPGEVLFLFENMSTYDNTYNAPFLLELLVCLTLSRLTNSTEFMLFEKILVKYVDSIYRKLTNIVYYFFIVTKRDQTKGIRDRIIIIS